MSTVVGTAGPRPDPLRSRPEIDGGLFGAGRRLVHAHAVATDALTAAALLALSTLWLALSPFAGVGTAIVQAALIVPLDVAPLPSDGGLPPRVRRGPDTVGARLPAHRRRRPPGGPLHRRRPPSRDGERWWRPESSRWVRPWRPPDACRRGRCRGRSSSSAPPWSPPSSSDSRCARGASTWAGWPRGPSDWRSSGISRRPSGRPSSGRGSPGRSTTSWPTACRWSSHWPTPPR